MLMLVDDDSEPILGQWFEETLSPSESQGADAPSPSSAAAAANDAGDVSNKHARHHGSADSICLTADRKEPDTVRPQSHCLLVITGFLQVRENWKKSGDSSGQGKVRGNVFWEKSGKMKNWCHKMSDFQAKMHQI